MVKTHRNTLKTYYAKRAKEYEDVYYRDDVRRKKEQEVLAKKITSLVKNRRTLEIACGTGYWTAAAAKSAQFILATDINKEVLEVASQKIQSKNVLFMQADAHHLPAVVPPFDTAMAMFWFSHLKKSEINLFFGHLHSRLAKNALVIIADGNLVDGYGGELKKHSKSTDTWKQRTLSSGEQFKIVKNYFSKEELEDKFREHADTLEVLYLEQFWMVAYTVKSTS